MKKLILLFALFFCFSAFQRLTAQTRDINNHTKSLKWNWDTIITYDTVGFYYRYTQTFDNKGNVLDMLIEGWNNNTWQIMSNVTYTYDSDGNLLIKLEQAWDNLDKEWDHDYKNTYTYDANGNMLTDTYTESGYGNVYRFTYTYDNNGNKLTYLYEKGNDTYWRNYNRGTYTYDSIGKLKLLFKESFWDRNLWENDLRYFYNYDGDGKLISEIYQDYSEDEWSTVKDITNYSYDSKGNLILKLDGTEIDDSTEYDYRNSYTYDSDGNLLTDLYERFILNQDWVKQYKNTYSYDATGNILTKLYEEWNYYNYLEKSYTYTFTYDSNENSISCKEVKWQNGIYLPYQENLDIYSQKKSIGTCFGNSYEAHWISLPVVINQLNKSNNKINVYPNPADQTLNINFQIQDNSRINIVVSDMIGREVINQILQKGKQSISINTSDLKDGMYILKFESNEISGNKKIVVRH